MLIAVAMPAIAFTAPRAAATALDRLTVIVDGYELFVHLSSATAAIALDASVTDSAGNVRAAAEAVSEDDGSARFAFISTGVSSPRRPILIHAGDTVTVRQPADALAPAGTPPVELAKVQVAAFTAHADGPAGLVSGMAVPNGLVTVLRQVPAGDDPAPPVQARADGRGAWQAAIGGGGALAAGSRGIAYYADGPLVVEHAWVVSTVQVRLGSAEVSGVLSPGETVSLRLTDADGRALAAANAGSWDGELSTVLRDPRGGFVPVLPGQRLFVSSTLTLRRDFELPPLGLAVDAAADEITGQTVPGRTMRLAISDDGRGDANGAPRDACAGHGGGPSADLPPPTERRVTSDGHGRFALDLAGDYDVSRATRVVASGLDAPEVSLVAYAPAISAIDPAVARVIVQGTAGSGVTATLEAAGGSERAAVAGLLGPDGAATLEFSADQAPHRAPDAPLLADSASPAPLQDGDVVRVRFGGAIAEAAASPLHVVAPAARDRVAGWVMPGATVVLEVGGETLKVVADEDGAFVAELAGLVDLRPGMPVALGVSEPDGVCRALNFVVMRATVQVNTDRVRIEGPPSLVATVAARLGLADHGNGRCTIVRDACEARVRDGGGATARLGDGDGVDVTTSEGETVHLDVAHLEAHVDPTGNGVTGSGPPNMALRLELSNDESKEVPLGSVSATDERGDYNFMFSTVDVPLTVPGLVGDVFALGPDGHQLWARGLVELVHATLGSADVRGLAEPGSPVDAQVVPAGRPPIDGLDPNGETKADADGHFELRLSVGEGAPRPLAAGQRLAVVHPRRGHEFTVPNLAAWATGADGAVIGFTRPGLAVKAVFTLRGAADAVVGSITMPSSGNPRNGPRRWVVAALVDPAGTFALDPPAVDARLVLTREVVATLPRGEEVGVVVPDGVWGGRVYLPAAGR